MRGTFRLKICVKQQVCPFPGETAECRFLVILPDAISGSARRKIFSCETAGMPFPGETAYAVFRSNISLAGSNHDVFQPVAPLRLCLAIDGRAERSEFQRRDFLIQIIRYDVNAGRQAAVLCQVFRAERLK